MSFFLFWGYATSILNRAANVWEAVKAFNGLLKILFKCAHRCCLKCILNLIVSRRHCRCCCSVKAIFSKRLFNFENLIFVSEPQHSRDDWGGRRGPASSRDGRPHLRGEKVPSRGGAGWRGQCYKVGTLAAAVFCLYLYPSESNFFVYCKTAKLVLIFDGNTAHAFASESVILVFKCVLDKKFYNSLSLNWAKEIVAYGWASWDFELIYNWNLFLAFLEINLRLGPQIPHLSKR